MSGPSYDIDRGQRANSMTLITAPGSLVVSLVQAREHLRLDATGSPAAHPDDDLVQDLLAAATAEVDGWTGDIGRALMPQTWEYRAPYFGPGDAMLIPLPPLRSVTSVKYLDEAGAEQTLATSVYRIVLEQNQPGRIVLNPGEQWPAVYATEDAVRIRFEAGYDDADAVPGPIKTWIKVRLGQFYENREAVVVGTIVTPLPQMDALIDRFRIRTVFQ